MGRYAFAIAALTAATYASPQNIDFAAVEAAPAVASGPTAVALANPTDQTASLYTSFTIAGPTAAPSILVAPSKRSIEKRDYFSDTFISTINAAIGSVSSLTQVSAGVSVWLSGASTHNIYGNLNNKGRIVISQTTALLTNKFWGGQTCDFVGHDANNGNLVNEVGASIQLNDVDSWSAPTYDWYLRTILNKGSLQFCGRGDTGGSTYQLYSDLDAVNTGLISFEQVKGNLGASFVWRNAILSTSAKGSYNIYNNGTFRLINTAFHNVQNVYGNGCWQIGVGATLYLEDGTGVYQNPNKDTSFKGQSIFFADASASLHLDSAVYRYTGAFGAQIFGFCAGHSIEFYETIKSYSYSAATGQLTVVFVSKQSVSLNIGLGYDASAFVNQRHSTNYNVFGYNAIFYTGACPSQSAPATCTPSVAPCSGLGGGLPSTSTSVPVVTPTKSSVSSVVTSTKASVSSAPSSASAVPSSAPVTSSSSAPVITPSKSSVSSVVTSSKASSAPSSVSAVPSSAPLSSSSAVFAPSSTSAPSTSSSVPVTSVPKPTCPIKGRMPYYPALATGYTTDPASAATSTTTANQPCVTQPEAGTFCGFINPEDPCAPQPDGYGPVPTPDTADAFLSFDELHQDAQNAPKEVPSYDGAVYEQVFEDLNANVQAQSYLGLYNLESYNVTECAALCDCTDLCTAFNIFAERQPSLAPSKNDSTAPTVWGYWCPNPASMTNFVCMLFGSEIDASMATNTGQWREDFHVVVTGSDGYDKTNNTTPISPSGPASSSSIPATSSVASSTSVSSASSTLVTVSSSSTSTGAAGGGPATTPTSTAAPATSTKASSTTSAGWGKPTGGYGGPSHPWGTPSNCHGKAINAPNYHLGSNFFPGPFNPQVCSDFAFAQSAANAQVVGGQKCKSFNAYYLHKNGKPYGTYCSLFNSVLDVSFATTVGGSYGADSFEIHQSWNYALSA